jgi:hypothetical protein
MLKRLVAFGLGAVCAVSGCGGDAAPGGNADAAKVIGVAPDSPEYGAASANLMLKSQGNPLDIGKKKPDAAAGK